MALSEEQLQVIADNPLDNLLSRFPDLLRTLPESDEEAWRGDVAALISALVDSTAALKLPLSTGSGNIATRLVPVRQQVAFEGVFSLSHFCPLIDAVVTGSSDTDIWTAVDNLIEAINPSTLLASHIIAAAFETPSRSCLKRVQIATKEICDIVERELFSEIRRCKPWGIIACTTTTDEDDSISRNRSLQVENGGNIGIQGTTRFSNMDRLPSEILLEVLQYLSKSQLKAIRLVCKNMRDLAIKFLFNTVYASVHLHDLAVLLHISADPIFRLAVHEVIYSGVFFNPSTNYYSSDDDFEYYCQRSDEQDRMLKGLMDDQYIAAALASMPNVRKVTLTNHWAPTRELLDEYSFTRGSLGDINEPNTVRVGGPLCRAYPADLEEPNGRPCHVHCEDTAAGLIDIDYGFWIMWNAISKAKTQIHELVIDYDYDPNPFDPRLLTSGISSNTFHLPSETINKYADAFRYLRRIAFSVCKPKDALTEDVLLTGNLGKILAGAHGLEELTFDFDEISDEISLQAIIGTYCWPRLHLLRLYRKDVGEDELNELIQRHCKLLKVLQLNCITLYRGTWQGVAEKWHSWLRLQEIRCDELMELKNHSTMWIDCEEFEKHVISGESAPLEPRVADDSAQEDDMTEGSDSE